MADAGIEKSEVDGFMSLTGALPPVELAEYLGLRPDRWTSTVHGGSIWECMVEHAAAAIAQGLVDVVVLTYGSTNSGRTSRKKLRDGDLSFGTRGPTQFAAPFGHPVGSHYAMVARRHMHEFGTTIEQAGRGGRLYPFQNTGLNPNAFYRDPITIADVVDVPSGVGPVEQAPLLYPDRRRRRHCAHPRGAGPGLRQSARLGLWAPAKPPPTRP